MEDKKSKENNFIPPVRGRASLNNPSGRFEKLEYNTDEDIFNELCETGQEKEKRQIQTQILKDVSRSILSTNDSPDIGMETTLNPYRGCEHGCIYCYARPGHEYLGLSAGLDFETKIFVKPQAHVLLRNKLSSKTWTPKTITLSGVTDCYQPIERKLKTTRACLEILRDFRNPVRIITKSNLLLRDIDIFKEMSMHSCINIHISITTLDSKLSRLMEPRATQPKLRLEAIKILSDQNIPVSVIIGPVLPGLTEQEIPSILKASAQSGAINAHYTMLRLPYGVKDIFSNWLEKLYPDRKEKILNRLRDMHGGKLYDSAFGIRMRGTGIHADMIENLFFIYKKRHGLTKELYLSTKYFIKDPYNKQLCFL